MIKRSPKYEAQRQNGPANRFGSPGIPANVTVSSTEQKEIAQSLVEYAKVLIEIDKTLSAEVPRKDHVNV